MMAVRAVAGDREGNERRHYVFPPSVTGKGAKGAPAATPCLLAPAESFISSAR